MGNALLISYLYFLIELSFRFLTQTRPADGTPEVYRSQPAFASDNLPGSMLSPSQSRPRAPLRTLSVSSTYQPDSPEHQPLRRLRKNVQHSSSSETILNSPTTPPLKQNAFDLLTQGAAKAHKRDEKKQRRPNIDLSEFFENEAAESDEENNRFGMVVRQTDDEENEEDLDQTLDVLMDDKEMDEETVAAGRVLEKYKFVLLAYIWILTVYSSSFCQRARRRAR